MLSLRQALKLPVFEQAEVVAGERGLDGLIRRAHVVDIPGTDYRDWGEGLLLFSSGYGFRDDPQAQADYVPSLARHGVLGMVFSKGWYFDRVPEVMRQAADEHNFPIIELPGELPFVHILERLYAELLNDQLALQKRADDIHHRLTRLVLEGGDLGAIAATLADILERSILIEGPTYELLASAQHGPVDENRLRTMEAGRTLPEVAYRLRKRGVYQQLQQKKRPIRLGTMPDIGMWMERVVAPIVAGGEVLGYIWIVAGDHPLTELDELAVDHAATVAALALLRDQAVRESQLAMRGDLLTQLLRPPAEYDAHTLERARAAGYRVDRPHQVLFITGIPANAGSAGQLAARLESWLRSLPVPALVAPRERGVIVVVESDDNESGGELAGRIASEIGHAALPLVVGVSAARGGGLRAQRDEAVEAAEVAVRLGQARVLGFWNLGLLDWLYHLPPEALSGNAYLVKVQGLAAHDARANSDLVKTLEAYLEYGGALAEAAAAINVHRNTLLYRLGRIEALAGVDLKDATQRLNLHVALKGWRLSGDSKHRAQA